MVEAETPRDELAEAVIEIRPAAGGADRERV
jgi:hypothetical protein